MQEQNQRTSPWLIAWRVIFTFALIGCIVFIFSNSLQIADVSEGASGRVLGILQGILRHLGLPGAADRLTMHIVRKLAHFCEYLLEGFLLMLCMRVYTRNYVWHISVPLLGGVNRLLGLVLGLANGAVDCWLLALLLWFAASITTGQIDWLTTGVLQRSVGYSFFGAFNPFLVHY
mgnify:CR=1 FL=1